MLSSLLRITPFTLSLATILQAATPDISNLGSCISEVRQAASHAPVVITFDPYVKNYGKLIGDLQAAALHLPHVYQEVAAKPLIQFLQNLGQAEYLQLFAGDASDEQAAALQQIIPDAVLAILSHKAAPSKGVNAFEEIVSDLYDSFLSEEVRVGRITGRPINPPNYGTIPPLVKFGNADSGPYTWPGDATQQLLGMGCGVVSLPPAQMNGGVLAWSALGHETAGHDVTHADAGLLDELAQRVYGAVLQKLNSRDLAYYWARCIDETSADVCGYLNMGPSLGIGLIGYFRALGDGKLRSIGSKEDPHPIDLLRGYLAAAVVKRLNFNGAAAWSEAITAETRKDNSKLYLVDGRGRYSSFPVSLEKAIASCDVVAQVIMDAKLDALQKHSLRELQDWTNQDQAVVDNLVSILRTHGSLPSNLQGPGFYAAYVVAAATQAALQGGADVPAIFNGMQSFLAEMHEENPTWSKVATERSMALLESGLREAVAK